MGDTPKEEEDVSGPAVNPSTSEGDDVKGDGGPTPTLEKKTNITGGGHDWDKEPKGGR